MCVKITPSHDFNDYEIGEKHKLEFIQCIDLDGKISNEDFIPENLRGKDRFEARKLTAVSYTHLRAHETG